MQGAGNVRSTLVSIWEQNGCGMFCTGCACVVKGKQNSCEAAALPSHWKQIQEDVVCVPMAPLAGCSSGWTEMANANLESQVAETHLISVLLHCKLPAFEQN